MSDIVTALYGPQTAAERRRSPRYSCQAGAEIVTEAGKQWATVTDLSRFGCYIETPAPLPLGEKAVLNITVLDIPFTAEATVVEAHPMFGMGVKFISVTADALAAMEQALKRLASETAAEAPKTAVAAPPAKIHVSGPVAIKLLEQINQHLAQKRVMTQQEFLTLLKNNTPA